MKLSATRPTHPHGPSLGFHYLFTGLASQIVLAVTLAQTGGPLAAFPSLVGALGLVMRWTATPVIVLFMLTYVLVYPTGLPLPSPVSDIPRSHFRLTDIMLAAAIGLYFASHYRMLSLRYQAVPLNDGQRHPQKTAPVVRPSTNTFESELARLGVTLIIAIGAGQIVWYFVCQFAVDAWAFPPVRVIPESVRGGPIPWPPEFSRPAHRLLLFAGGLAGLGSAVWFGMWYWRLSRLTRAEAEMCALDSGWRESRRELNRQAKWRAWTTGHSVRPTAWRDFRDAFQWILWLILAGLLVTLAIVGLRLFEIISF